MVKSQVDVHQYQVSMELNEAQDLANILKAGKLPAPARIVEEAVVGPFTWT